jgi:hypothetical protein
MLAFVSAHIQWNAISNRELRPSYMALCDDLAGPSPTTVRITCRREYQLTMDAMTMHLLLPNKLGLGMEGCMSTYILATKSFIAHYLDRNWALGEIQLSFLEVNCLFCSPFEM